MTSVPPAVKRDVKIGLAVKLAAAIFVVFAGVAAVLSYAATSTLERDLTSAFRSKGEAIALAMAAAAERSAKGDPLIPQKAIDANHKLEGVDYIFAEDATGQMYATTFAGELPAELAHVNTLTPGQVLNTAGVVNIVDGLRYQDESGKSRRVIDVAAPVAYGTLGTVRVGMDSDVVDRQVKQLRSSTLLWGIGVGAGGILLFLAIALLTVVRPIDELTRVTGEIVRRGDLRQTIRVRSNDEIGRLAHTFTMMVDKLREIPATIHDSTEILESSVDKLSDSVTEQGHTATRQAAALQETQVTAQEIRQTSLLASQKAEAVLQYAERADTVSRTGELAVERSLGALVAIRMQVGEIAERIAHLGTRATQIGNVTQTVKDLADQSNMLALTAAIEAVRSGEHGHGFGVVAREMRSLADQSIQGTKQVGEMLADINAAIREAVIITNTGVERIDVGLGQVRTSGRTLSELSGIVKDNSTAVRQISAAVGQQNAGIAQIFDAVSDQSKMMEDTILGLGATSASLQSLRDAAEKLVAIVEQFRV